jgi:uncharacterized protein (DUF58 family)
VVLALVVVVVTMSVTRADEGAGPLGRFTPRHQGERLRLGLRNLYILPTRFGWWWLAGALLLQLLGIQMQQPGPLLLSNLMLALLLLALHLTHLNLQGLELACGNPPPGFAGGPLAYPLVLQSRCRREGLQLGFTGEPLQGVGSLTAGMHHRAVPWTAGGRGLQRPGLLRLQTTAPLGLFVCWSLWQPARPQLIYPARRRGPVALVPPVPSPTGAGTGQRNDPAADHDWHDLAPHRPQEGLARLAWKQLAQGRGRLSKRFASPAASPPPWLAPAAGLPLEQALEHLSERIGQLAQRGEPFGLRLPDRQVPTGSGERHRRRCLEALALCRQPPA